ncbi:M1 family metallopeptidase [Pedobacter nutrimenti]|uniref:M1 family metallopeptidase n=1 Tax=Pedobacter nutrimenti TaxID=1241337 RepID=UPI0029301BDD|nr:M1 family metallopeptidase [Pedobacter nutrimenti]
MTRFLRKFILLVFMLLCIGYAHAQQKSVFDPLESFKQVNYPAGNLVRTASGKPGTSYWQNRADYQISARFDTLSRQLQATEELIYFNDSPDVLPEVWLLLGQNRFRKDSRSTSTTPLEDSRFGIKEFTDGFVLEKVMVKNKKTGVWYKADAKIMNDQLKIMLPEALRAKDKITLRIDYHFTLPKNGSDFMGVLPTANGTIYQFSAWFPRVAVYDDIEDWNTANSGYYIEPGKLDYKITVPSECIVQGTGQLLNPEQVLTKVQLLRLRAAEKSNETVQIRTAKEVMMASSRSGPGLLTWHFSADHSGDGLFAVSRSFIWDAVKVDLPDKETALAMSLYPVESNYAAWQKSVQTMKQVLESYSRLWCPYPYKTAVNIAGSVTGIGGPGTSFIQYQSNGMANGVWSKLNHELGHNWFNMMIAGNGRQVWMVEGLNSFINHINGKVLQGETAFTIPDAINWLGKASPNQCATTPYELMLYKNFALLAYVKPTVALNLLRTEVLGTRRFDAALRTFVQAWKFKHPSPSDFFRCMEKESGENLSWFWQSWFLNDWTLDQSIESVQYVNGLPEKGVNIKLVNKGKMVMPAVVEVAESNGRVNRANLPAEIWQKDGDWTFHYPSTSTVISVKIDPDHNLPDRDLTNNTWHEKANNITQPTTK